MTFQGDVLVSLYFISRGSIEIVKDDVVLAILGVLLLLLLLIPLFNRDFLWVETLVDS